jgi:hypothetical protein
MKIKHTLREKVRDTSYKRAEHVRTSFRKVTREREIQGAKEKKPFLARVNRRPHGPSSGHQNKKICCLFKFNIK